MNLATAMQFARYSGVEIPTIVYEHDDMRGPSIEYYLTVGRAAIEIIARAMLATGKTEIRSVLDLPSGAGRVTRHLRAFFPEAELFVCDIERDKAHFAAKHFGATFFEPVPLFDRPPARLFDLVFVGSLLTHLDEPTCRAALAWMIAALNDDGLLIFTTQGRRALNVGRRIADDTEWAAVYAGVIERGFNFWPLVPPLDGQVPYGATQCTPSWLMRILERDESITIAGLHEAGWVDFQDVITIAKRRPDVGRKVS